ncbi:MAG: hypothetical protein U1F57_05875 [bacterium]
MTTTYSFTAVDRNLLSQGDFRDPFRFYHNQEPIPARTLDAAPRMSIEVVDRDGNRQLNEQDEFYYRAADGSRRRLASDVGLNLLNYYVDPNVLGSKRLGMVIRQRDQAPLDAYGNVPAGSLQDVRELTAEDRDQVSDSHFPYWEADRHLDMDILEGLRLYTAEENSRWTGFSGLGIYFNGRYFLKRVLGEKGAVAGIFMAGEHFINPTFMWQMYTTNFISMVGGSLANNNRREGVIDNATHLAENPDATNSIRRLANLQTADARSKIAQDHLYFTVTWPVVIAACFADPNFRQFWPAPWRVPRFNVLGEYFYNQFRGAVSSMGSTPRAGLTNPLGLGLMAASSFGLYEISSAWFDVYGGMRSDTTENRAYSGIATAMTEAALLNRASREMLALTGSPELSFANFSRLWSMSPEFGVTATLPEGSALARFYESSPRVQAFFQGRAWLPTVEVAEPVAHNPLGRFFNWVGAPHISLEARVTVPTVLGQSYRTAALEGAEVLEGSAAAARTTAAVETVLSRAALTEGGIALTEGAEATVLAEEAMSVNRVRIAGLPLLGVAAVVGLAIGADYLINGQTPRDRLRQWSGR